MKEEYSTGAFAKMCHLSKRTLFYYDEINLLKPVRVDENGYRWYALYQSDIVSTIKLFQKIGLSLKEIQDIFDIQDLAAKERLLAEQQQMIQAQVQELQQISQEITFLGQRLHLLQKKGFHRLFEEELLAAEYYRATPKAQRPSDSYNFMNYGYQYGLLFEQAELRTAAPRSARFFQRATPQESNFIKPAGRYLSIFRLLKNEEILTCIPEFLQELDLASTTGPLFHEDYGSELAGFPDQFVIKLSIQIK